MKKVDIKTWVILGLILVILFLWWRGSRLKSELVESENFIEALSDTLYTWKDKEGKARARIQVLQSDNEKSFLALKTSDSLIIALQDRVREFSKKLDKLESATIVQTVTTIDTVLETIVIDSTDTDTIDGRIYVFPTYTSPFDLKGWVIGDVTANRDSISLKASVKNAYAAIIGYEKDGWFKRKPYVEVINDNPYTETTGLRAYQVTETSKKIKISLGAYIGYGVTRLDDSSIRAGPQAGAGLLFHIKF